MLRQSAGAMGTPLGGDGDIAQALRTLLGSGIGRSFAAVHARRERIHGRDDEEVHRQRDEEERDQRVEEGPVLDDGAVQGDGKGGKIGLAEDGGDERSDDVGHQRGDHNAKRGAHHYGDGKIDHVAAHEKLLEALEHGEPPWQRIWREHYSEWRVPSAKSLHRRSPKMKLRVRMTTKK